MIMLVSSSPSSNLHMRIEDLLAKIHLGTDNFENQTVSVAVIFGLRALKYNLSLEERKRFYGVSGLSRLTHVYSWGYYEVYKLQLSFQP